MTKETTDKSIVVRKSFPIPNARELASLCLFHDQVIVCRWMTPNEWRSLSGPQNWLKPLNDYVNILETLEKGKVVRIIEREEMQKDFRQFFNRPDVQSFIRMFVLSPPFEYLGAFAASQYYNYPLVTNDANLQTPDNKAQSTEMLSEVLEQSTICQLALPDVKAVNVEDLLEARTELKDELLEFRAGILKLTWLLHQQVQNKNDLEQIRHEADTLTNTIIKGSLISLENRMKKHKKKRIRRMLFSTGRVLVEATKLFLPSGAAEKMISSGKTFLQLATEIDSAKPPEDQVATYLYKLKGKIKT